MKRVTLLDMKAGQKGKVLEINGENNLKQRLMHMGIYPGREITKASHLVLRGPVTVRVGRAVIALAHSITHKIKVEMQ
jgi:Fe2+ transport system protein FeoA